MNRKLSAFWELGSRGIARAFAFFILGTAAFGTLPHMQQRSFFAMVTLILTFIVFPASKRGATESKIPWWDLACIALVLITCGNIVINWKYYLLSDSAVRSAFDYASAIILLLLVFEAARRSSSGSSGYIIIGIVAIAIAYTFAGPYIPGIWGHRGFSAGFFLQMLYQSDTAFWGPIVGVIAAMVSMFIIFGAILEISGGGKTFIDIACLLMGKYRGGPALVAVFSSALFGMLSGSAVANVSTTGTFTIPLMKNLGYKKEFAAAVEATASTGGQIMPPIMAAAAFIMAEILNIPYIEVVKAALIPAVLYFFALFAMVLVEAAKQNLAAIPEEEMPDKAHLLTWGQLSPFIIPVIVLIIFLVIGYDPYRACFYSTAIAMMLFLTVDFSKAGWLSRIKLLGHALDTGIKNLLTFVPLILLCSVLVGLLTLTGIAPKISSAILAISGHKLALGLIFAAIATLFLGMGLPTPAAYIVGASVIAPSLIQMGVDPIAAHLFVLYYAVISNLTPPVCIAVVVASIIADGKWTKAAWVSMRLGVVGYCVPFAMVYRPGFIMVGSAWEIILVTVTAIIGILLLSSGFFGYLKTALSWSTRFLMIISGFLFFLPSFIGSFFEGGPRGTNWMLVIATVIGTFSLLTWLSDVRRVKS